MRNSDIYFINVYIHQCGEATDVRVDKLLTMYVLVQQCGKDKWRTHCGECGTKQELKNDCLPLDDSSFYLINCSFCGTGIGTLT